MLRQGRPSSLTQKRIDLLNGIDFTWKAKKGAPRGPRTSKDEKQAKKKK
jgi:hypothetical protein